MSRGSVTVNVLPMAGSDCASIAPPIHGAPDTRTRDYYRVEDLAGRRFWVYRAGLYQQDRAARWYLHGVFA